MKTILQHGKIYIEEGCFKQAMVIENGIITFVGDDEIALSYVDDQTTIIDLQQKTVVPGFNDSHLHFYSTALALSAVDCMGATSIMDVIERGKHFLKQHPDHQGLLWGRGWNQDYFQDEKRLMDRHDLDQISTAIPIVFARACGHVVAANTKALTLARITPSTKVEGGHVGVDESGELTGVLSENAIKLLEVLKGKLTVSYVIDQLKKVSKVANAYGITSVQTNDITVGNDDHAIIEEAYKTWAREDATVKVYHQICFKDLDALKERIQQGYDRDDHPYNRYGPLKLFTDGSLGARTAFLRQPYHDDPSTVGIPTMTQKEIKDFVKVAHDGDIQIAMHAIGDAAMDMVLRAYETHVDQENILRHGIIHCQITDMPILRRMKDHNIMAYLQPIFLHYDMHIVEDRVGSSLAATSYAFYTMDKLQIHVAYGTDAPVEPMDVIHCIHCAVNRQDLHGYPKEGFYPDEKVSVESAIDHYTIDGAYASFEETIKGRLLPGYVADLVVLDKDIFSIDPSDILSVNIDMTMVDGKIVYQR